MDMQQAVMPGTSVFGAEGDKVGTVRSVTETYLVVEKGFFFPKDYYVPMSAVNAADDDAIYLSVTKDEALNQGWDQAPMDTMTSSGQIGDTDQYSGASTAGSVAEGYVAQEDLAVPVHEEHLEATKRVADAGEVTISKQVVTEQESIQVPVTEERVRVEWREPSGDMSADGEAFREGSFEIPVSREEVDISKRTVQTGEVHVTKEAEQRTQRVTDSVRREVVDVDDTTIEGNR